MKIEANFGSIINAPKNLTNQGYRFIGGMLKDSLELAFPSQTPQQYVREMKMLRPLHDAKLGEKTLERGNKMGQEALVVWGGLMIVTSIIKADETRIVPDTVTKRVCEIAHERDALPIAEPYLHQDVYQPAGELLEKYLTEDDNVIHLFSAAAR